MPMELSKRGYSVLMVSNQKKELSEKAMVISQNTGAIYLEPDALGNFTGNEKWVSTHYADLSREEAAQELFDFCNGEGLDVEILVNNAGIFIFNDIADCSTQRIDLILKLHVYTVTMLCRLFGRKDGRKRPRLYPQHVIPCRTHTLSRNFTLLCNEKLSQEHEHGPKAGT